MPDSVWDGGENVKVKTQKDAVDVIVSVDSSTLKVRNVETGKLYRLFIVLGNDNGEAVADYSDVDTLSFAVFEHYDRWCQ